MYNKRMLNKAQKIAILSMLTLIGLELAGLMSLVYFTKLPFFFFIFAVVIRLFSFFLIGAVALFALLTILGIEWWRQHMRELARFFGTSVIATVMIIAGCILMGLAIFFVLRKVYFTTSIGHALEAASMWVARQFY